MELKDFVKKVIMDLDQAVTEANAETKREVRFKGVKEYRTALEFDVAVTVESTNSGGGGGAIQVLGFAQIGGSASTEQKNSSVSRVSFGVDISEYTKAERQAESALLATRHRTNHGNEAR